MHAFQLHGIMPYNTKAALIGRGNVGNGALKILTLLGADVHIYNRRMEKLLRDELSEYDVIVNAVLWDTNRNDHIIYKSDLKRMKKGSMIIDISCDRAVLKQAYPRQSKILHILSMVLFITLLIIHRHFSIKQQA